MEWGGGGGGGGGGGRQNRISLVHWNIITQFWGIGTHFHLLDKWQFAYFVNMEHFCHINTFPKFNHTVNQNTKSLTMTLTSFLKETCFRCSITTGTNYEKQKTLCNFITKNSACRWPSKVLGHVQTLQWRHDERDGVLNHRRLYCLFNRLFRRRSKKTSKLRVTGLCEGNSPMIGEFPAKWTVTRKMFPFDDAMMDTMPGIQR